MAFSSNWEKGCGIAEGLKSLPKDMDITNVSNGIICGVSFGIIAVPLIQKAASVANLSPLLIESWVVSTYLGAGLIGVLMSLMFKLPIAGGWSIPGAFALAQVMGNYPFEQAVGGFFAAGVIVLLMGVTGLMKKAVAYVPTSIMMAMVAGTLFSWASKLVPAFKEAPAMCFIGLAGFALCKLVFKKMPAVLGALVFGLIGAAVLGQLKTEAMQWGIARIAFVTPSFSVEPILSIGLPLAILVMAAENMQAIGVQLTIGKKPPVNAMTIVSGIGGIFTSFMGGHNCNIAGPMTAWCASPEAGEVDKRYVASFFCGIAFALTGIFAPVTIGLLNTVPSQITTLMVGLVVMGIIIDALAQSFGCGKFKMSCFAAFVVAMSGIVLLNVGSAFWSLVAGSVVALVLERKDFEAVKS